MTAAVLGCLLCGYAGHAVAGDAAAVGVRWVVDGDTVVLADGRSVRYIGINTPEAARDDHPAEPFSAAATRFNRRLVGGDRVRLEFDVERRDRYGRWLAYVFLPDGRFVNAELVRAGWAHVLPKHPNTRYDAELLSAQRTAMAGGKGIWTQLDGRDRVGPFLGNRRSRRFHRTDCPSADRIHPNHRVSFATLREAFWSGYAPAGGCLRDWWMGQLVE